ncbi:MAG: class I SAM-dependent methyltransferase [Acidobacteriota bacterium]|nr:class I SAM-dependent methyltransferase [Acidobacteriota bacterium]
MAHVDFITSVHTSTTRDYVGRVTSHDKAECAEIACRFGQEYWDGDRHLGYGGYRYDGRWRKVAEAMVRHYGLKPGARILDVGCGKGFLLYEFTQVLPGAQVAGIDISAYAIEHAKPEIQPFLQVGTAASLPYPDKAFDFVVSLNTLHNLYINDLFSALREIERVGAGSKHVCIEAYRDEREKANLLYWQLTCRAFHTPEEWEWIFDQAGYSGDYSYITFN